MVYTKQTFVDGTTRLKAEHLDHIEQGIVDVETALSNFEARRDNPNEVTAEQTGARPNTWTPTAEDVGARANTWLPTLADIGAAPSGYGLGGNSKVVNVASLAELNNITANGWYTLAFTNNLTIGGSTMNYAYMQVSNFDGENCIQKLIPIGLTSVLCRFKKQGVWDDDFEWENPPMWEGVEFRTTERFMGSPVYTKLINCGTITDGKNVTTNIDNVIRYGGRFGSLPIPFVTYDNAYEIRAEVNSGFVVFTLVGFGENTQGYLQLWYTK